MSNSRHLPGCACQTENGPVEDVRLHALLFKKLHGSQVASVELRDLSWPEVIVWEQRVFLKATTGHEQERYVEAKAHFARRVRKGIKRVKPQVAAANKGARQ